MADIKNTLDKLKQQLSERLDEDALDIFNEYVECAEDYIDDLESDVSTYKADAIHYETKCEQLKSDIRRLEDEVEDLEDKLDRYESIGHDDNSLDSLMKDEWWSAAKGHFTLPQLEDALGNRFNLKRL